MAAVITASESNRVVYQLAQVADAKLTPDYKWFSLHNNKLDGSYHPVDATGVKQLGWWGKTLSDASGILTGQQITMTESRVLADLQLVGDVLLNEFPVNFTITLYNGATVVYTETVINNTLVHWSKKLTQLYTTTSVVINITKINKPNVVAKIVDAALGYVIITTDNIKPKTVEVGLQATGIYGVDSLVTAVTNSNAITVSFSTIDQITPLLEEAHLLTNVHSRMNDDLRQVFGKVEITYIDPFLDETITLTASEQGQYTDVKAVADNFDIPEYKWFSLHDNILDGSYHPMALVNDLNYHAGWWGTQLSTADGSLLSPPVITVSFGERPIYSFKVEGDSLLNNFPVDFDLAVKNSSGSTIHVETITNNSVCNWQMNLDTPLISATSIQLTIRKINKAYQVAKIMEFFTSVVETYYNEEIVDLSLLEELDYVESSITLGAVSSNEIDITLDNSNGKFDMHNEESTVHGLLKRNRRVRAWLGVEIEQDIIEWYPLGVFWTTNWNTPDRSLTATVTARDRLDVLSYTEFIISQVYVNYTLGQLFTIVLNDAGLRIDEYVIDTAMFDIVIPYAWFDKMSHRDALQRLAACALLQLYCDRLGRIVISTMASTVDTFFTFEDDKNVITKDYPFAWSQITNYVEVTANSYLPDIATNLLTVTENIVLEPAQVVDLMYSFNTIPAVNVQLPTIDADAGIVLQEYSRFAWGVTLRVKNTASIAQTLNGISITGQPLKVAGTSIIVAKDIDLIRDDGMLKTPIGHDFIQTSNYAQTLADSLLAAYKESRYDVSLDCRGNIGILLGEKINVLDSKKNQNLPYAVKRQSIKWDGYLSATVEGKKLN